MCPTIENVGLWYGPPPIHFKRILGLYMYKLKEFFSDKSLRVISHIYRDEKSSEKSSDRSHQTDDSQSLVYTLCMMAFIWFNQWLQTDFI